MDDRTITLFLCGDVMTGRGIDQILPYPESPELFEPVVSSARSYVDLAEACTGAIPRPVDFDYFWGDALQALAQSGADVRIINLETAVTACGAPWPGKQIHYRMNPKNLLCLTAAGIDCCVLANNHVLDWGRSGLVETVDSLHRAGIRTAGAGRDAAEACAPGIFEIPGKGRVLVFALGARCSGIPLAWAATADRSGLHVLDDLSERTAEAIAARICAVRRPGDLVVVSIHWGGNWGHAIPAEQRAFAERLIDRGAADAIHGHSSHHVKGIQIHRDRPILYGCGDFLNDYEGISGYECFRGDLGLMYLPRFDAASGRLVHFSMIPTRIRRFRIERAPEDGIGWLLNVLNRQGEELGTRAERSPDDEFVLRSIA